MKNIVLYSIILLFIIILLISIIVVFYIIDELYLSFKLKKNELIINYLVKLITCLSLPTAIMIFMFDKIQKITIQDIIKFIIFTIIILIIILFIKLVLNIVSYFIKKSQDEEY